MNKLSQKIIEKIKKNKINPKPKWYFILMHTLVGTATLSSILIGAIATAIVIRHLSLTDWELMHHSMGGHIRSFFMIVPYIWIIFIGITILLAELIFKQSEKAYRIESWKITLISIITSIFLGGLFYITNADRPIENGIRNNFHPYLQWEHERMKKLIMPEKGIIAGEIIQSDKNKKWIVIDFKNHKWIVDIRAAEKNNKINFKKGMQVGIIGEMIDKTHFKAGKIHLRRRKIVNFKK